MQLKFSFSLLAALLTGSDNGRMYRCAGGKRRIASLIVRRILEQCEGRPVTGYCEPFLASGAVCLELLKVAGEIFQRVWLNDLDRGTFALWWSLLNEPKELRRLVHGFKPSRKMFFRFKRDLLAGENCSLPELALRKLAVHQLSFSGLGVRAGGPMSAISSRWSPRRIDKNIDNARCLLGGKDVTVTNLDYKRVLSQIDVNTFIFADPPFYVQGGALYQYAFTERNHEELCALLSSAKFPWLLSYDDCPKVRQMYPQSRVVEVPMTYTIHGITKKSELLIAPKTHTTMQIRGVKHRSEPLFASSRMVSSSLVLPWRPLSG